MATSQPTGLQVQNLVEAQAATLLRLGMTKEVEVLSAQKDALIGLVSQMSFKEGRIFCLPVVPRATMLIAHQVWRYRRANKLLFSGIGVSEHIISGSEPSSRPYWLLDVEDGSDTFQFSFSRAKKTIACAGESCLTSAECLALAIHSDVLQRHQLLSSDLHKEFKSIICVMEDANFLINLAEFNPDAEGQPDPIFLELTMGTPRCRSRVL